MRFRRDGMIVPLADSVRELVRNLKGKSECISEWSAFSVHNGIRPRIGATEGGGNCLQSDRDNFTCVGTIAYGSVLELRWRR